MKHYIFTLLLLSTILSAVAFSLPSDVPSEVSNLSLSPDPDGLKVVDISFTAPSTTVSGAPLASFSIEISRDDTVVKTIENAAPARRYLVVDEDVPNGSHVYSLVARNGAGKGRAVSARCYVGVARPAPVSGLGVNESDTPEEVEISWTAPVKDISGRPIETRYLTYNIYSRNDNGDYRTIAKGISNTTYKCHADNGFVNFVVVAVNDEGESDYGEPFYTYIGKAETMPYGESGMLEHDVLFPHLDNVFAWQICGDNDIASADGDGRFFCFKSSDKTISKGARDIMVFGKISVSAPDAALSFYVYRYANTGNILNVYVVVDGHRELVSTIRTADLADVDSWNKVIIPLAKYAGKNIVPIFEGVCEDAPSMAIDNIEIASTPRYDLRISDVSVPDEVYTDMPFVVSARIDNVGSETFGQWRAALLHNSEIEQIIDGKTLEPAASTKVEFDCRLNVTSPVDNTYNIRLVSDADMNTDNNTGSDVGVTLRMPVYPVVGDLNSALENFNLTLRWLAPDLSKTFADPVTEDFESFGNLSDADDGWKSIDADGAPVGIVTGLDKPVSDQTSAFFTVADNAMYKAHSGSKSIAAIYCADRTPADDWLISPALAGCRQWVSLWLNNVNGNYREDLQFYYSAEDTDRLDRFMYLSDCRNIAAGWHKYSFEIPEGAMRFAVRRTSSNGYMLMLDDISYRPEGIGRPLTLIGYNVYLDGAKITTAPIADTSYRYSSLSVGNHQFGVSAVYDCGESMISELVVIVDESDLDRLNANPRYKIYGDRLECLDDTCVAVYSIDGRVAGVVGKGKKIHLRPGVYFVTCGLLVDKIVIR